MSDQFVLNSYIYQYKCYYLLAYISLAETGWKLSGAALHWMVSEPTKSVQLFMALYSDCIELRQQN